MDREPDAKPDGKVYDQSAIWTSLVNDPVLPFERALEAEVAQLSVHTPLAMPEPVEIIVHLLFANNVTPHGSLIFDHMQRSTISGHERPARLSEDELMARGYLIQGNGKVFTVNDIPAGSLYLLLHGWGHGGSSSTYHGWGMAKPVTLDVNRKGNPNFMDNNMAAFTAYFNHFDRLSYSMKCLNELCVEGIKIEEEDDPGAIRGGVIPPVGPILSVKLVLAQPKF
ncbi:MAG: hypothetical protein ACYTBJ_05300 [Planctomycetota bacterium]